MQLSNLKRSSLIESPDTDPEQRFQQTVCTHICSAKLIDVNLPMTLPIVGKLFGDVVFHVTASSCACCLRTSFALFRRICRLLLVEHPMFGHVWSTLAVHPMPQLVPLRGAKLVGQIFPAALFEKTTSHHYFRWKLKTVSDLIT